jgi:RHS repeat-associated protein
MNTQNPVEYGYDVQGRKKTMTTWQDYSGASGAAATTWIYNPTNGTLARKEYNDGKGTDYTYTPGGQLKTRTWARTHGSAPVATLYSYDDLGQLQTTEYTDDTETTSYTYDRMGRMKTASNGNASYTYDYSEGLLTNETVQISGFEFHVSRNYDSLNRSAGYSLGGTAASQSVSYGYDLAGRFSTLTSSVSSVSSVVQYSYNPSTGLPDGHSASSPQVSGFEFQVSKSFDGFNRLHAVTNSTSVSSVYSVVSSYVYGLNDLSQRTSMNMDFGTNGFSSAWNYQYDTLGQLSNAWKTANGAVVPGRQYGYQFDDIGNRKQTTRGNNRSGLLTGSTPVVTSDYTANLLNQYSQRTIPAYAEISGTANPDAILSFRNEDTGTRIRAGRNADWFHAMMPLTDNSITGTTNEVRMTAVLPEQGTAGADLINTNQTLTLAAMKTPEIFDYDDDGNLLSDGRFSYVWNAENRLVAVSNATTFVEYAYDYMGRVVSRAMNGVETTFLWDGWNMISEISPSTANVYVWGVDLSGTLQGAGGVGGLVTASLNGTNVFYCADGNGNVSDLIDDAGTVVAHYEYDPFGNHVVGTGLLADSNPWRFSSKFWEPETGLLHYELRPYSPSHGKWLNRDPLQEKGGLNLYGFAGNDPVLNYDYLGGLITSLEIRGDGESLMAGDLPYEWNYALEDIYRNIGRGAQLGFHYGTSSRDTVGSFLFGGKGQAVSVGLWKFDAKADWCGGGELPQWRSDVRNVNYSKIYSDGGVEEVEGFSKSTFDGPTGVVLSKKYRNDDGTYRVYAYDAPRISPDIDSKRKIDYYFFTGTWKFEISDKDSRWEAEFRILFTVDAQGGRPPGIGRFELLTPPTRRE